ncbi:optic atrophy 3 protein homolog [Diachasmimorpha longicaudata]|uniref:optic atrophy 3 protein homolog n=1 Tax=Diachasmimorpha longicaudata TaxID=58733 RepID=UPI0030B8F9B6
MKDHFPLSKLVVLLCRQLAKPLSLRIVNFARGHRYFRYYGLVVPGKIYHRLELNTKRYLPNDKSKEIEGRMEIGESEAIEIGAQLVLEGLVFTILAGFLILENNRSSKRNELMESERTRELNKLEERKAEVVDIFSRQAKLIHELRGKVDDYSLQSRSSASVTSDV